MGKNQRPLLLTLLPLIAVILTGCPSGPTDPNGEESPTPIVSIDSGPMSPTNETSATFVFSCDLDHCSFECALGDSDFESCSSPAVYEGLEDGDRVFLVRGINESGEAGEPARWEWTIDTVTPVVLELSGPADPTNETTGVFTFECSKDDCSFSCRLDGSAQGEISDDAPCASGVSFAGLEDDTYTFTVVATDPAGNTSEASTWSWTVDTVAPSVIALSGPSGPTNSTTAEFTFGCSEIECVFTCRLDGASQGVVSQDATCSSGVSYENLTSDSYTFSVVATNPRGNTSEAATWSWIVDTVPPLVAITASPPAVTFEDWALFEFECTNKSDCTFDCALDFQEEDGGWQTGTWQECDSPYLLSDLDIKTYQLRVRGTDSLGNEGVAEHSWSVMVFEWVTISAGNGHSCGIDNGNSLWCWGSNGRGQLGLGDTTDRSSPVQVGTASNWARVSTGGSHTCAVSDVGGLWCWGGNWVGQLGDGTRGDRNSPVRVGADRDWTQVSAGDIHTCAIENGGGLWCWGNNTNGRLGNGTTTHSDDPVAVGTGSDWDHVSAGHSHTCAIEAEGGLWCWGSNWSGQLGDGNTADSSSPVQVGSDSDWALVAAGSSHNCAVTEEGSLWCWGSNMSGQLGEGGTTNTRRTPVQAGTDSDWALISAGRAHTCATKTGGSLWCWGDNEYGHLGDGTTVNRGSPVQVGSDSEWAAVSAGTSHTCAVREAGGLWCWGTNGNGNLGVGEHGGDKNYPVSVNADREMLKVSAGTRHSCGIAADGSLWCWGSGKYGQLGDGTLTSRAHPVQVGTDTDWDHVSTSADHTCGAKTGGSLWCWGRNNYGQLGDGTWTTRSNPVRVGASTDWALLSVGQDHNCATNEDGELWCWGRNTDGRLGDGGNMNRNQPVRVGTETDWAQVAVGLDHTCAAKTTGTLWCWGSNGSGQLGDGTTTNSTSPVQVGADSDWEQPSTGRWHTCAIKSGGSLWCWGGNASGRLGDGTNTSSSNPVQVGTDTDWAQVSAGRDHTCGVRAEGGLWCWGGNGSGQLGDATNDWSNIPVQVEEDTIWSQVSAGLEHTCAARPEEADLWCWGSSGDGQLGDGTAFVLEPSEVLVR